LAGHVTEDAGSFRRISAELCWACERSHGDDDHENRGCCGDLFWWHGHTLAGMVVMAAGRRGRQDTDVQLIGVVLPEQPPVLTPLAAAALLRLLRNVEHRRAAEVGSAEGSVATEGREAA
jgi:hypothetical protein